MRDFRSDTTVLGRVLIPAMEGRAQIPIAQLADIRQVPGLSMYRDEDGLGAQVPGGSGGRIGMLDFRRALGACDNQTCSSN